MKKIYVTLMFFVGFATGANAQGFTFGPKAGFGASGINNANINSAAAEAGQSVFRSNDSFIVSFKAGVFAEWRFNRFFGVSPEVVYSRQGTPSISFRSFYVGHQNTYYLATYTNSKVRLDYINVPVLVKIYPFRGLRIDLGPQAGFLTAVKIWDEAAVSAYKGCFRRVDLSLCMGLTIDFTRHIFLQGRYNLGLTDISRTTTSAGTAFVIGNGKKVTNRATQFSLGYRFGSDGIYSPRHAPYD